MENGEMKLLSSMAALSERQRMENNGQPGAIEEHAPGIEQLIGVVQEMIEQSGNPEGFSARRWVLSWIEMPVPALGGATPASFMNSAEGRKIVTNLLLMSQSGAYA
jgi:hypothetical protein